MERKGGTVSHLPEDIKRRVFAIMGRLRQERYMPLVAPEGVTPSEATVITAIHMSARAGVGPVQPHIIAKGLHHTPSAVSQTLKALEEKGYLVRERMSGDSRAVSLILTERGIAAAQEADRMYEEFFGDLLAYIGRADADHLLDTFEKILSFHRAQADAGKMERIDLGGIFDQGGPGCEGSPCA